MASLWSAFVRTFLSVTFVAAGLALFVGGIWLVLVGGSLYYALAGSSLVLIGALLYRRNSWSFPLYALLNLATLIWAAAEVGRDWWQLMPRGNFIVLLGLMLGIPSIARSVTISSRDAVFKFGRVALFGSLFLSGAVALFSALNPIHDLDGKLPPQMK